MPILIIIPMIIAGIIINDFTKTNIKESLIEEKSNVQMISAKGLANNVAADLELIALEIQILSEKNIFLESDTTEDKKLEINNSFEKLNEITPISDILILNKNFIVTDHVKDDMFRVKGLNLEGLPAIKQLETNPKPTFSAGILGSDEIFRILISQPILNQNNEFLGIITAIIEPDRLFAKYGILYNIESQFMLVTDSNGKIIISPVNDLLGREFSSEFVQLYFGNNPIRNQHYDKVISGNPTAAIIIDHRMGEVINVGHQITVDEQDRYFLFLTTPTSEILTDIEQNLFVEDSKNNLILIAFTGLLLLIFIKRYRNLESEKMITVGQLSSNIAHDMRNPLGTIKNSLHRIEKQNNEQNETITQEIQRTKRSITRMSHQIEGVLNYVRTTPLNPSKQSITKMLETSIQSIDISKNIQIQIPKIDTNIECDEEKMRIVFENLLLNAVQAIGENKGKITINIENDTKSVIIKIQNSGPNISEDALSRVFEPLYTSKLKGTGLGLSSCKNIIEQHQGEITVSNNPVTFTITLPKSLKSLE